MLNRSTNERIVCVSYSDELNGWKQLEKELKSSLLKSPPLKFSSNVGTPISCELSSIKFLNESTLTPDQLKPTTDGSVKKTKGAGTSEGSPIDPYAAAHEKPFLRLCICVGDEYKRIQGRVTEWMKSIGEFDEWLIIHLQAKEGGFFSRSIATSLKGDFVKGKIDRVCVYRTFDLNRATNLLDDVILKIREGVARSGQQLISEYAARMRSLEAQRNASSFNFLSFFALKEGLALVYEALRSPSTALAIYDELETLYERRQTENWRVNFSAFGGTTQGDDSGSLLDFGKKPYRTMLLAGQLTEFDFRQYLFSRQGHLLFMLNLPKDVLTRGLRFISTFENTLSQNKCKQLFVDVWCFSAYMDLAEACKAANQTAANDPSITYILGDTYHSAITRLDSLGAEFDYLPATADFVCSAEPMTPFLGSATDQNMSSKGDESEEDDDDAKVDPASFTSPLKTSTSDSSNLVPGSPLKISSSHPVGLTEVLDETMTPEPDSPRASLGHPASIPDTTQAEPSTPATHPAQEMPLNVTTTTMAPPSASLTKSLPKAPQSTETVNPPDAPSTDPVNPPDFTVQVVAAEGETLKRSHSLSGSLQLPSLHSSDSSSKLVMSTCTEPLSPTMALYTEDMQGELDRLATSSDSDTPPPPPPPPRSELADSAHADSSHTEETHPDPPNQPSTEPPSKEVQATLLGVDPSSNSRSGSTELSLGEATNDSPRVQESRSKFLGESLTDSATLARSDSFVTSRFTEALGTVPLEKASQSSEHEASTSIKVHVDNDSTPDSSSAKPPASQPIALPKLTTNTSTTASPPRSARSTHRRNLSKSNRRGGHSRNSSIGEDIVLDDLQLAETDLPHPDDDPLGDVQEEGASPRNEPVSTFQELQMAILSTLKDATVRLLLAKALELSKADVENFEDASHGAVFSLSYLQATGFIGDDILPVKLAEHIVSSSDLAPLHEVLTEYITAQKENISKRSNGGASSSSGTQSLHSTPTKSAAPSSVSASAPSTPSFKFTTTISTDGEEKESRAASSKSITHTTSKHKLHFHNLRFRADEGLGEPTKIDVDGVTITHPSLSSALSSAAAFDKLYKTIALKSNAAFNMAKRSRSSIRIKNTLGNLAFVRGHWTEALKYFDETLIDVYVAEGWYRLLFTLYNKMAECYTRIGQLPEFCSTLLVLLSPRLASYCSPEQRTYYQKEFLNATNRLISPLPVQVATRETLDKMIAIRVAIKSPVDGKLKSNLREIGTMSFALGDTVSVQVTLTSAFPSEIVVDKFYVTFQAVNPKTQRTRSYNMGIPKLKIVSGTQTIVLNAPISKGRWGLASYSILLGKVTLTMPYYHPGPVEATGYVHFAVTKSPTATKITVDPPAGLALGAKQHLKVKIATNEDSIKEATLTLSVDRDAVSIPDGFIKATLTSVKSPSTVDASKAAAPTTQSSSVNAASTSTPSPAPSSCASTPAASLSEPQTTECDVAVKGNLVLLPELAPNSLLSFFLPIQGTAPSSRNDGQLSPLARDLLVDMVYRKPSNEKKTISTVVPLRFAPPLFFEHVLVKNESASSSSASFFATFTVRNQLSAPVHLISHSVQTHGSILVVQDYTAALQADSVLLEPGDFTTLVFALANPQQPMPSHLKRRSASYDATIATPSPTPGQADAQEWMSLQVVCKIDEGVAVASEETSYPYHVPLDLPRPVYQLDIKYESKMVVGEASPMTINFFLVGSAPKFASATFGAFYRIKYEPTEWVVIGRTYGKLKIGSLDVTLNVIPLTATATPPQVLIEEFSNTQDSRSRSLVNTGDLIVRFEQPRLLILPKQRITSVCREIVEP